jgi:hypothetical protein
VAEETPREDIHWEGPMLEGLARAVAFPPAPDMRSAVLARIAAEPPRRSQAPAWRFALAGVAVVIAVAAFTVVLSRDARDAVAGFLGLAVEGERIEVLPTPPAGMTATPFPASADPNDFEQFARRVTTEEAAIHVGALQLPASLGEPAALYAITGGPNIVIADFGSVQVWQMPYTGEYFIGKGINGGGTVVQEVRVNGHPGYWVSGGERLVSVTSTSGNVLTGTQRVVTANALLWSADGLYHRIEGAGTLEEATRLAEEIR